MKTSEHLTLGNIYSRKSLSELFSITDRRLIGTHGEGIFRPTEHDSIWLFVTFTKPKDRKPYKDILIGDDLFFEGQEKKRTDELIIKHMDLNLEILLFSRERKETYENYGYKYEGPFHYVAPHQSTEGRPTRFYLRRGPTPELTDLPYLALSSISPSDDLLQEISSTDFDPLNILDDRKRTIRTIAERRGQASFRERLLKIYGGTCAISGCATEAVLEAAHIAPYRGSESNNPSNGILLRADLHLLFDLGLISINSETLTVLVSNRLIGSEYEQWSGRPLRVGHSLPHPISKVALDQHRLTIFIAD